MRDEFPGTFTIKWGSGYMILVYCEVFPAAKAWLTKLIKKVICLDWEHEKAILTEIAEYLEYNIYRTENDKKPLANKASNALQVVSDMERQINEGKRPNGVPLTKDEIKQCKERLKDLKYNARAAKSRFDKNMKANARYADNLKIIRQRLEEIY